MARTLHTIPAADLPTAVADPQAGVFSLAGDSGGSSLITGEIYPSNISPGLLVIETEHGSIYRDLTTTITITKDNGRSLEDQRPDSLAALNDIITAHLDAHFDWYATDDDRADRLNDITLSAGELLDDLLTEFPATGSAQSH